MLEESGLEVEIKNLACQVHWEETEESLGLTITLRCRGELRWAREESAQLALGEGSWPVCWRLRESSCGGR